MKITKKVALITGSNKGIGFETARQMAQLGYFVYLGCRDKSKGLEAVQKLHTLGFTDVDVLELDVTNASSIAAAKQKLQSKTAQLDVLINNAGIAGEMPQAASVVSIDNIKTVFETNFFGAIQTTQHFLDLLRKADQPRIVNVSSDLGSLTNHSNPAYPFYEVKLTAYCSSKTALNAFTVMLAFEFKDTNFKINSVNPGYTATDLNGHRGTQTVEQGASTVVKYATLEKDGPTGKFFSEDGETAW